MHNMRSLNHSGRGGWLFFVVLGAAPLIAGCGGESAPTRYPVSGSVSYDGQSIEDGTIAFVPTGDTKGSAGGGPIKEGKYSLTSENGPVAGKHKVEIRANKKTGEKIPAVPPATGEMDKIEQYIPAKYNTATTLEEEIKAGENTIDFNLQK